MFVRGLIHTSFNITKILANVSVETTNSTKIFVDYSNELLLIRNLSITDHNTTAKVIDMQGNVVFQFPIIANQENKFSIPLSLPVGAYILNIEEQAYKFLVLE